jgi:hypothetical protein
MKKLPYKEGDVFGVPLRNGGFALGVVARVRPFREGNMLLGYFFRHGKAALPKEGSSLELNPQDAALIAKFGDLSLYRKEWPIVGNIPGWDRRKWPMPSFMRRDPLSDRRAPGRLRIRRTISARKLLVNRFLQTRNLERIPFWVPAQWRSH